MSDIAAPCSVWKCSATLGHARFLTFSCHHRLPLLRHDAIRELFLARLLKVCDTEQVRLLAWVLMPEHVHVLLFPDIVPQLERFTHSLKRPVAETVLRRWRTMRAPILKRIVHGTGHRFWQTGGGYDEAIQDPQAIRDVIEYIHQNPVRRGLATNVVDYPWSSARWYAGYSATKGPCGELPFKW